MTQCMNDSRTVLPFARLSLHRKGIGCIPPAAHHECIPEGCSNLCMVKAQIPPWHVMRGHPTTVEVQL